MKFLKSLFKRPVTIIIMIVCIVAYGAYAISGMSLNLLPDISFPMVGVTITYVGADAETVDEQVSTVVYDGLSTLEDVHDVITYSMDSVSLVAVQFDYGVDLDAKQTIVKDKVNSLDLPSECGSPNLLTIDFNGDAVTSIALYSTDDDFADVYQEALELQKEFQNIKGVGDVTITGAPSSNIQISTINGLEQFSLLIVQALSNGEYDIPLGSLTEGGETITINNSSFAKSIEDIKNTSMSFELSSQYQAMFTGVQQLLNYAEDVTTTELDDYKKDIDNVNEFIDLLEDSSNEELDQMVSSISAINAIINLEENYSATSINLLWTSVLKPVVQDPNFVNLTDDELRDLANDLNVSYDLLKWMQDNNTTMDAKWQMLVDFRVAHPTEEGEQIPDAEYVQLFYDLEIFSNDPNDDNYMSEEDMLDVIALSRQVNTVALQSAVGVLEQDAKIDATLEDLQLIKDFRKIIDLPKNEIEELYTNKIDSIVKNPLFLNKTPAELASLSSETGIALSVWKWMQDNDSINTTTGRSSIEDKFKLIYSFKDLEGVTPENYCDLFYDLKVVNELDISKNKLINLVDCSSADVEKINAMLSVDDTTKIENHLLRKYTRYVDFIGKTKEFMNSSNKANGVTKVTELFANNELKNLTNGVLEDYAKANNLSKEILIFIRDELKKNSSLDYTELYSKFVNSNSISDLLYETSYFSSNSEDKNYVDSTTLNEMLSLLESSDYVELNPVLRDLVDGVTPTDDGYAAIFKGSSYDESGIISGTTIGIMRSFYFEDNYNTFYEFKKLHQHLETQVVDGTPSDVFVGEDLTSAEFMELYNNLRFEEDEEIGIKLNEQLIDFVRNSDFSNSTFVTTIGEIANVYESNSYSDCAYYDGVKCINLNVYASSGSNSSDIVSAVREIVESYVSPNHSKALMLTDESKFISDSINNMVISLIIGGVLAVIVIYLFLRKVGSSLIISITMPLSIVLSLICLNLMGITLNMVSVGGLAVGIGMLVDNSIVVLESISAEREKGKTALEASVDGVKLVIGSLIGSTITSICVFFPILFMNGLTKEIFADLAWAVTFSLVFSLICAVLVIPTLYCLWYGKERGAKLVAKLNDVKTKIKEKVSKKEVNTFAAEGAVFKKFKNKYGNGLGKLLHHRGATLGIALGVFAASIGLIFTCDVEFLPSIDQGRIEISVDYLSSQSLDECETKTLTLSNYIEDEFEDRIDYIATNVSNESMFAATSLTGTISVYVDTSKENSVELAEEIRTYIRTESIFDSMSINVTAIDGVVATLTSGMAGTSIMLQGEDIDVLEDIANEIQEKLATNYSDSFKHTSNSLSDKQKQYTIDIDQEKCYELGIDYSTLIMTLRVGISGYNACNIVVGEEERQVVVSFADNSLSDYYDGFANYIVSYNSDNKPIYLKDIASITYRYARTVITKTNGLNVVTINAETYGISTSTAGKIFKQVANEVLAKEEYKGYTFAESGISSYLTDAFTGLITALIIAFFLLIFVMACQFESFKKPFIILFSFPLAFTGAFIALSMTRMSINVVSFIGLIMLMGVIVNDAIVLLERIEQVREEEPDISSYEAVVKACKSRLRAVIMTTVTTVIAMFPVALGWGDGGALMQPLGIVIIGGMTLGTIVTLIIIPTIYCLLYKVKDPNYIKPSKKKKELPTKVEEVPENQ